MLARKQAEQDAKADLVLHMESFDVYADELWVVAGRRLPNEGGLFWLAVVGHKLALQGPFALHHGHWFATPWLRGGPRAEPELGAGRERERGGSAMLALERVASDPAFDFNMAAPPSSPEQAASRGGRKQRGAAKAQRRGAAQARDSFDEDERGTAESWEPGYDPLDVAAQSARRSADHAHSRSLLAAGGAFGHCARKPAVKRGARLKDLAADEAREGEQAGSPKGAWL